MASVKRKRQTKSVISSLSLIHRRLAPTGKKYYDHGWEDHQWGTKFTLLSSKDWQDGWKDRQAHVGRG